MPRTSPNPATVAGLAACERVVRLALTLDPEVAALLDANQHTRTKGSRYDTEADRMFKQAVELGRLDPHDFVVGASPDVADLGSLVPAAGGYPVDVAVAVLMRDVMAVDAFELVVATWRKAGLPITSDPVAGQRRPPAGEKRFTPDNVPPARHPVRTTVVRSRRYRLLGRFAGGFAVVGVLLVAASGFLAGRDYYTDAGYAIAAGAVAVAAGFVIMAGRAIGEAVKRRREPRQ